MYPWARDARYLDQGTMKAQNHVEGWFASLEGVTMSNLQQSQSSFVEFIGPLELSSNFYFYLRDWIAQIRIEAGHDAEARVRNRREAVRSSRVSLGYGTKRGYNL